MYTSVLIHVDIMYILNSVHSIQSLLSVGRVNGIEIRAQKKNKIDRCKTQCAALVVKMLRPVDQNVECRAVLI